MVQEYQSPVRVYKHPFELIMAVSSLQNIPQHFHSILELSRLNKVTSAGFILLLIKLKEKHMIIFGIKGLKTLPSKGGCSKYTELSVLMDFSQYTAVIFRWCGRLSGLQLSLTLQFNKTSVLLFFLNPLFLCNPFINLGKKSLAELSGRPNLTWPQF